MKCSTILEEQIEVTEAHVRAGLRGEADRCPLARAMDAAGYVRPSVEPLSASAYKDHEFYIFMLSVELTEQIRKFDGGGPFEAGTYTLRRRI